MKHEQRPIEHKIQIYIAHHISLQAALLCRYLSLVLILPPPYSSSLLPYSLSISLCLNSYLHTFSIHIFLDVIYLYIYLSICLSIYLSIHIFRCTYVCLSTQASTLVLSPSISPPPRPFFQCYSPYLSGGLCLKPFSINRLLSEYPSFSTPPYPSTYIHPSVSYYHSQTPSYKNPSPTTTHTHFLPMIS